MRATSSRSSPSSSRRRLESSTIANGSTNSVWPELLVSCTMPGTGAARARAHGDDGPSAALRDEVLLQVRLQVGIGRERAQAVARAPARRRELGAQRLQLRRGGVLHARRVELERALELVGDDRERLGDLARARGEQRGASHALAQVTAHAERGARGLGDRDEPVGAERAAAARMLGVGAHVVRPRHPRRPVLDEAAAPPRTAPAARATSPASGEGSSASASARPAEKDVWFASRSRIAASSSTSSA